MTSSVCQAVPGAVPFRLLSFLEPMTPRIGPFHFRQHSGGKNAAPLNLGKNSDSVLSSFRQNRLLLIPNLQSGFLRLSKV